MLLNICSAVAIADLTFDLDALSHMFPLLLLYILRLCSVHIQPGFVRKPWRASLQARIPVDLLMGKGLDLIGGIVPKEPFRLLVLSQDRCCHCIKLPFTLSAFCTIAVISLPSKILFASLRQKTSPLWTARTPLPHSGLLNERA